MYWISQEGLTNVAKHSRASRVRVDVVREGADVRVRVVDDGAGVVLGRPRGSGLVGIEERVAPRGGTVDLVGRPGGGTLLDVRLPVGARDARYCIAIVDDQELIRDEFCLILSSEWTSRSPARLLTAGSSSMPCAATRGSTWPWSTSGCRSSTGWPRPVRAALPHAPAVIVVTTFDDDAYVLDAIAAGARGIPSSGRVRQLIAAVRTVAAGGSILSPEVTAAVLARVRSGRPETLADVTAYGLTSRELEILRFLAPD